MWIFLISRYPRGCFSLAPSGAWGYCLIYLNATLNKKDRETDMNGVPPLLWSLWSDF